MAFFKRKNKKTKDNDSAIYQDLMNRDIADSYESVASHEHEAEDSENETTLLTEQPYESREDSENETTLLTEQPNESLEDSEGETTLLTEQPYEQPQEPEDKENLNNAVNTTPNGSNTLNSDNILLSHSPDEEYDEEEYEGQTSLLSEEYSPYLHPELSQEQGENTENRDLEYQDEDNESWDEEQMEDEDEEGGTTLLSSDNSRSEGIYIPDTERKAYLIKIIQSEKIRINKIKFVIGSSRSDVDYCIENPAVSRKHAFIIFNNGEYYIMDNKSTNKTLLDGEMLEPQKSVKLYHGALIQFSDELFQFMLD